MKYDVDLLSLIPTKLKRVANVNGRGAEYAGACPFCGGADRLRVQPDMGLWWCRQCSESEHWEDAPNYVMRRDSVTFVEALRTLGLAPPEPDTWDYHDEHGEVVYQVVRFAKDGEKSYAQRTPKNDGSWQWGLKGTPPTIYRLPDVLRAAAAGGTIYITEGEKCADALRRHKLCATTNSGGAGKWRDGFAAHLQGAGDVVIFADNDEPGERHAQAVLRSVLPVVQSARVVRFQELPIAGDVADWFAQGHDLEALLERCAPVAQDIVPVAPIARQIELSRPPSLPMGAEDLLALERKPVRWYAPDFLRQGFGLMVGQPQIGKTPLAIQLAIAISQGDLWMNRVECRRAKVLYLGMEYSRQEILPLVDISRCGKQLSNDWLAFKTLDDEDIFPGDPEAALGALEWFINVHGFEVIIIDVMTGFLPPEKFKQNVYRGDYAELKPYHALAMRYNASILGVWHGSKREADPRLMYNGSTGLWAAAASRITLYTDQEQRVRIASFPRMGEKVDWALTQERHISGRKWVVSDAAPEPLMSDTERGIYRFLKSHANKTTPLGPMTIAEMTGIPIASVKVTVRRMLEKNLVQQTTGSSGYFIEDTGPQEDVTAVTSVTAVTPVTAVTRDVTAGLPHHNGVNSPGYKGYNDSQVTTDSDHDEDAHDIF